MSEKLIIELELRLSKLKEKFKKLEDQGKKSGEKTGSNFSNAFKKHSKAGFAIAAGFIAAQAAVKGFTLALRVAKEGFNNMREVGRGIAEINTLLPKTKHLTEESTQKLQDFARSFGTTQQAQVQSFYNIVSAGVKGLAKQQDTLAVANKAALAGLVDIDTAARALVSSMNAYATSGLTAIQASDALFVAVREGQTTFGELAANIGNVAPIASAAGLKFHELTGAVSGITKAGIRTDIAITGMRAVLSSLIKVTPDAQKEADKLGLSFGTAALKGRTFADFLKDVQEKTKGSSKSLGKLFPNIRALGPILQVVTGDFKDFKRIQEQSALATGSTAKAADIMKKALDFNIKQMNSEWTVLVTNLMTKLKPAFLEIVKTIKFVGKAFNRVFDIESTKPIDVIGRKISTLRGKINGLIDANASRKGGWIVTEHDLMMVDKNERKLVVLGSQMKKLQADRQTIIKHNKMINKAEADFLKANADKVLEDKMKADTKGRALIANTSEYVFYQEQLKLEKLQELRNTGMINESMHEQAKVQLRQATQDKLDAIETQGLVNADVTFSNMAKAFELNSRKMKFSVIDLANTIQNGIGKGFGNAFQDMGKAMREGESELDAFADAMQKMIGQMASQLGDYFIAHGIAQSANPLMLGSGAGMIAGGLGLKFLAGLLDTSSGGASSGGGGGAGGGSSLAADTPDINEEEDLERQTSSALNITVEGSLVQQEELGSFISTILSESNEKNGNVILNPKFA